MGSLFVWIAFRAGRVAGQFQTQIDENGRRESIDGHLIPDTDDPFTSLGIAEILHDITFVDGQTAFSHARLQLTTDDGRTWDFDATPLRPPWDFSGSGYSGGWDDGAGLGVAARRGAGSRRVRRVCAGGRAAARRLAAPALAP